MAKKPNVLLIHTGGTIGMTRDHESGVLKPDLFYESLTGVVPELSDIADIQVEIPFVIDSSEINASHWKQLGHLIKDKIDGIDGVVITHGTDTLAYTASALSYMLMNVPVPVILTGAQKPLSELRTDARTNFINSIELATRDIHEVGIFFDDKLMRGNRTIKSSIDHFDAFTSPNYPLLARVGIDVDIYRSNIIHSSGLFHIFDSFDNSIAVFKSFPGCRNDFFQPTEDIRAIVIFSYGAGNIALNDSNLLRRVDKWLADDKIVVIMSETKSGRMNPALYEAGDKLLKLGALHSGDMTFEASITKLMFLLGQYRDAAIIRKNFCTSLAGELTET
jgi:L-asparaginase